LLSCLIGAFGVLRVAQQATPRPPVFDSRPAALRSQYNCRTPPLIEQLKVGGRLIMPLGSAHTPQQLTVIEKIAPETRMRSVILVGFVLFIRSQD
jgi:hypothetical protein